MLPVIRKNYSKDDSLTLKERESWKILNSSRTCLCRNSSYNNKSSYYSSHSQGSKMPIILNVFSLSDASDSNSKEMTRNISQENNIPRTLPCLRPCALIELETTSVISDNYSSCNGSRTYLPYGFTNRPSNATVTPTVTDNCPIYNSVKKVTHCPQETTNGFTGQLPQPQNHKKHTSIEYRPNYKTVQYSCNVVNSYFTGSDDVSFHSRENPIVHSNKYLGHKERFVPPESNVSFKRKKAHCDSKNKISAKRQYVFEKLLQHIQRNQDAKIKSANGADNIELKITSEQHKSNCHRISNGMDIHQQCSDQDMEQTFGKYSAQQNRYSELKLL